MCFSIFLTMRQERTPYDEELHLLSALRFSPVICKHLLLARDPPHNPQIVLIHQMFKALFKNDYKLFFSLDSFNIPALDDFLNTRLIPHVKEQIVHTILDCYSSIEKQWFVDCNLKDLFDYFVSIGWTDDGVYLNACAPRKYLRSEVGIDKANDLAKFIIDIQR